MAAFEEAEEWIHHTGDSGYEVGTFEISPDSSVVWRRFRIPKAWEVPILLAGRVPPVKLRISSNDYLWDRTTRPPGQLPSPAEINHNLTRIPSTPTTPGVM